MAIGDSDDINLAATDAPKIPSTSISWAYPDSASSSQRAYPRISKGSRSVRPLRPPYILHSHSEYRSPQAPCSSEDRLRTRDSPELNSELVGVKCAEDVLGVYEAAVGFDVEWDTFIGSPRGKGRAQAADSRFSKDLWDALMDELAESHERKKSLLETITDEPTSFGDWTALDSHTTSGNESDMSASFTSASSISMPATPRQRSSALASIVHSLSPSPVSVADIYVSSSTRLNAAASTFIPSPSKTEKQVLKKAHPPSSFTEFTFPSLSTPPVTVKFRKDEQGFYTGIDDEEPPESDVPLLPAFLQKDNNGAGRRKKSPSSRTRAIIDRLRSSSREPRHAISLNPSPSPSMMIEREQNSISDGGVEERDRDLFSFTDDGWINVGGDAFKSGSAGNVKDTRTKELFKALRRHRSDSGAESLPSTSDEHGDGGRVSPSSLSTPALSSSSSTSASISSPSSANSFYSSTDGWMEGIVGIVSMPPVPAPQPSQQSRNNPKGKQNGHKRRQSSARSAWSGQQGKKHNQSGSLSSTPTAAVPTFFSKPNAAVATFPVPPYHASYAFMQPHQPQHHHSHSHSFSHAPAGYYHYASYPMGQMGVYPATHPAGHGYVSVPMQMQYPGQFGQRPIQGQHPHQHPHASYTQAV